MTPDERAAIEAELKRWEARWKEFQEVAGWIAQAATEPPEDGGSDDTST